MRITRQKIVGAITPQRVVGAIVAIGLGTLIVTVAYRNGLGFANKDLFKWLEVLIFPLALGVGLPWLTSTQRAQREREREVAQAQRERELELESQRAQDSELRAYLDQMGMLLLDQRLRNAEEADDVRAYARARTLTALSKVDGLRKGGLIQFLCESRLIRKERPIISLVDADLRNGDFRAIDMSETDLSGANLRGALLREANLSDTDLSGTDLSGTDLSGTDLSGSDLSGANLRGALLREANLSGATRWTEEQLYQAESLEGATMPDGQTLKSAANHNGPTFEDWLKSKRSGEDEKNE